MPLNWLGALLVFISCGSIGVIMASAYRREAKYLSDFVKVLDYMLCELEYRLTPLPRIFKDASSITFGTLQKVLMQMAYELESQISPNACCCMRASLQTVPDIPVKLKKTLLDFAQTLGCFELDGQLLQLRSIREITAAQLKYMQVEEQERTRRYQTLGFCAGAGLAILLL